MKRTALVERIIEAIDVFDDPTRGPSTGLRAHGLCWPMNHVGLGHVLIDVFGEHPFSFWWQNRHERYVALALLLTLAEAGDL